MDDSEKMIMQTYGAIVSNCAVLLEEGSSPMLIAACMSQIAMGIYKDSLNEEEYEIICDKISDSRHIIRGFLSNTDRILH